MSGDSEQEAGRQEAQETDFDSLFILNEEDKADLVAKQQQISFIRRGEGGSGAGSPARGSPARRTQVRHLIMLQCYQQNLTEHRIYSAHAK